MTILDNYKTTTVAEFNIQLLQFLDQDGRVVQPFPAWASDVKQLHKLYEQMVLMRTFDTKAINLQRIGKLSLYPSALGQEATSVAAGNALQKQDLFCPYYRDIGTLLQRGYSMADIFTFWSGDERGNNPQTTNQDLPMCLLVAGQFLHAVGAAFARKYQKQDSAVLTICGEGATSKGDFYEALNMAGIWNLPIVFIILNNKWAISTSPQAQTKAKTFAQKGIAAGIESLQVDGNDIIAMQEILTKALAKVRHDQQPILIEAISYRLGDHTTTDDARRYRSEEEVAAAKKTDPIVRLRTYLIAKQKWSDQQENKLVTECKAQVETATNEFLQKPAPNPQDIFDYLYGNMPEAIKKQRAALAEKP